MPTMASMNPTDSAALDTAAQDRADDGAPERDWWHRDHPTFTALSGFFAGMIFVTAVPGALVASLRLLLDFETVERYFPLLALVLVVPLALVLLPRSRRFGKYMWIGMVLTLLVVGGVASVVLYFLVRGDV